MNYLEATMHGFICGFIELCISKLPTVKYPSGTLQTQSFLHITNNHCQSNAPSGALPELLKGSFSITMSVHLSVDKENINKTLYYLLKLFTTATL